jgi:hypothetical protein
MTVAALAASLVWAALAPGGLEVTGDSSCPTPSEVAARLAELAPAEAPAARDAGAARVIVTYNGTALRLVLIGPNANELAARELAPDGTCADLAAAAAVIVAAWQADLDPALAGSLALPPKVEPSEPAPPPIVARAAPPAPAAAPRALELGLGLGLLVSDAGAAFAPGAILTASLRRGRLGLDASLDGTTSRSASVGSFAGAASWTRVTLAAGPAWRPRRGAVRASLHVQGLLGVLHVSGADVPNPGSDTTAELGGAAGGRIALVTGTSALWLGFDARGWPGTQHLIIANYGQSRLARLELVASLGLELGLLP